MEGGVRGRHYPLGNKCRTTETCTPTETELNRSSFGFTKSVGDSSKGEVGPRQGRRDVWTKDGNDHEELPFLHKEGEDKGVVVCDSDGIRSPTPSHLLVSFFSTKRYYPKNNNRTNSSTSGSLHVHERVQ